MEFRQLLVEKLGEGDEEIEGILPEKATLVAACRGMFAKALGAGVFASTPLSKTTQSTV